MAHLLSLFTILSLLLLLFPSSSLAHDALFSDPLQILYGGENLTDGDLTLSLSNKCSLVLYKAGDKVLDFKTTIDSTKHCALLVSPDGQLHLVPDNELIPTTKIGKKTYPGRYALLFIKGKLGIFGPAIANGEVVIAENNKVSAVITPYCTLSVKYNSKVTVWETEPRSSKPTACELSLKSNGELLLQGDGEAGVYTQWNGGFASEEKLYVCLLRYNGQILVYGLKSWLYQPTTDAAIKMVVP
ncbi:hypothetical protein J5N97_021228 [Dioscorea zingiberensis]|uniref:Bulb-type lectin domain-containing protein n=1 Tax=Dioscorea zingiberensis TaxID=325984 RepID=A0A9D5CHV1_9LILI|nr:hypothetical protein J5N97_021228 [Dioscorea zingiberensis]